MQAEQSETMLECSDNNLKGEVFVINELKTS